MFRLGGISGGILPIDEESFLIWLEMVLACSCFFAGVFAFCLVLVLFASGGAWLFVVFALLGISS